MKKTIIISLAVSLIAAGALCGYALDIVETSKEAINIAKKMSGNQDKVSYLIDQAKGFYDSEKFKGVIDIAKYILAYLDKDSVEAKGLLEKAKAALASKATGAVGGLKKKFGF